MAQIPMETIIEKAKQHGYAPVRYPTGELLKRRCPECWTPGAMVIFRHETDKSTVDIYACECGYRRYGG
jgi:predicted RNA-binding Zn-ribbon protein involved in translation (DUF1610 family)